MRFSLKWMLGAVALVGFGCVALYNANEAWAMAAHALTIVVLLVAILGSIYLRPRAFYLGMCIFGWGYLILTYVPPMRDSARPLAATDALLDVIHRRMQYDIVVDNPFANPDDPFGGYALTFGNPPGTVATPNEIPVDAFVFQMPIEKHFQTVGHSLFALVFAIIGGVVGQCFSRGAKCDSH